MKRKIRTWYIHKYPSDKMGRDIPHDLTFAQFFVLATQGVGVYTALGINDNLIVNRVLVELSMYLGCKYTDVYNACYRHVV